MEPDKKAKKISQKEAFKAALAAMEAKHMGTKKHPFFPYMGMFTTKRDPNFVVGLA